MARFQSGNEIIDVWRDGNEVMHRRYRIGTDPPSPTVHRSEHFGVGDDDYWDGRNDPEDDARGNYWRHLIDIGRGWRRVRDPDREPEFLDEPRDVELERAIRENPDDVQALLVYADFLQQRGYPRGQLIMLDSVPLTREVEVMRDDLIAKLAGPLVRHHRIHLEWRYGFIRAARLEGTHKRGDAEDILFELVRHPSARFLRELTIACEHLETQNHRPLVHVLMNGTMPLRKLHVVRPEVSRWLAFAPLGDIGALGDVYPDLEDIRLEGENTWTMENLNVPRAKRFALETQNMRASTVTAVLDASWPVLEELELTFGAQSPCTIDDVRLMLDGTLQMPMLRTLRLYDARFAAEARAVLDKSPLTAQLTKVEI